MNRYKILILLFLTLFLEANPEQRVALVIGNNNYQRPLSVLYNPINDAKAMKYVLEKRGFEVMYDANVTKREMRLELEKFYKKIKNGGVGLFYFAGHGMELEGKNYLIPIDATPKKMIDVEFDSLPLDRITKNMQRANNRLNIVILDACRNNPFIRGGGGGLAKSEPIGLFLSYATEAGKVALDGERGGHGLFTENLIKYIKEPLNLQQVFKKTREAVYNASNKKQFPAIYDQTINGEFFFTKSIDKNISNNSISKIKNTKPIINQEKESYGLQTILKFFISNKTLQLL